MNPKADVTVSSGFSYSLTIEVHNFLRKTSIYFWLFELTIELPYWIRKERERYKRKRFEVSPTFISIINLGRLSLSTTTIRSTLFRR